MAWDEVGKMKGKVDMYKKFMGGTKMGCSDESKLEPFELQNDKKSQSKHFIDLVIYCVSVVLVTNLLMSSFNQIGSQKSQSSSFSTPSTIQFSLEDLENLLEMKLFSNMSTEAIEENMDCHVNGNTELCLRRGVEL